MIPILIVLLALCLAGYAGLLVRFLLQRRRLAPAATRPMPLSPEESAAVLHSPAQAPAAPLPSSDPPIEPVFEAPERTDSESRRALLCSDAITRSSMDGFFILDAECRFLEVNEAFCRMTGYSSAELRQMKISDLEAPAPACGLAASTRLKTGVHQFTTAHRRKDGGLIRLESSVSVVRDNGRKILAGFTRDVTERIRAEEALMRSEKKYRDLVETSSDLIWAVDCTGRWTFVNSAARRIYGHMPHELIGRPFTDCSLPENAEPDASMLERALAGHPIFQHRTRHARRDGQVLELVLNATVIRGERGEIIGVSGTATDVTQQQRAQRELQEAHERFGRLVARMPLGYVVWTRDLHVREWNPAAESIFGYPPSEALGRHAHDLIVGEKQREAFARMWERVLRGENGSGGVFTMKTRAGQPTRCEWFSTLLPEASGQPELIASMIVDVSERENLEAQVRQSQRLESLGSLAGGVAHDFNNLLTAILGNVAVALDALPSESDLRAPLRKIETIGERATELTRHMLAYAGQAARDVRSLDLNALVSEMTDLLGMAIPRNVELRQELTPSLPAIEADSGQMQQVIMNLLINAAEAIGERPGRVVLATRDERLDEEQLQARFPAAKLAPGNYVCLSVTDDGCGMPPETVTRIFEPFFTTKFTGRGLGLSAILGIVRSHGGAISVQSEVQRGTTFVVAFPASVRPVAPVRPVRSVAAMPENAVILVIDDEAEIRSVVEKVLRSRGVRVLSAEDGPSGLELFRQHADEIDAVLLDMTMPEMTGETVFRELVAIRPDATVVVSSGFSEQQAVSRFGERRPAAFVHKPYTARSLFERLGAVVAGARARREAAGAPSTH